MSIDQLEDLRRDIAEEKMKAEQEQIELNMLMEQIELNEIKEKLSE